MACHSKRNDVLGLRVFFGGLATISSSYSETQGAVSTKILDPNINQTFTFT